MPVETDPSVNPPLSDLLSTCSVLVDDPNVNLELEEVLDNLLPSPEEDPKVNGAAVGTGLDSLFISVPNPLPSPVDFVSCADDAPNEKEGAGVEEEPKGATGAEVLSSL